MSERGRFTLTATPRPKSGFTETDLKRHAQELGMLGRVFGSKEHAPFYIAALAIVFSLVAIMVVLYTKSSPDFPKTQAVTLFGTIITGGLGFIFGRSTS